MAESLSEEAGITALGNYTGRKDPILPQKEGTAGDSQGPEARDKRHTTK